MDDDISPELKQITNLLAYDYRYSDNWEMVFRWQSVSNLSNGAFNMKKEEYLKIITEYFTKVSLIHFDI